MDTNLYASILLGIGLILSVMIGCIFRQISGCMAVFVFFIFAISIGILLGAGAIVITDAICKSQGAMSLFCIKSNPSSVWSLSFPLLAIPIYWVVMLVAMLVKKLSE